jgi:integrase/recombinase XerD
MRDNNTYHALETPIELTDSQSQIIQQADNDEMLIRMWLHGRSTHTQRAYRRDITAFLQQVNKSIRYITLADLQSYVDDLLKTELSPTSIKRTLWAIKSLFTFSTKINYTQFNVGLPLKLPAVQDRLTERILSEEEVHKIIESVENFRNRLIIKTLYYTAIRVSELVRLKWKDLQLREEGGQLTILGKGGKTNTLLVPQHLWNELMLLRDSFSENAPVFRSPDFYLKCNKALFPKDLCRCPIVEAFSRSIVE